MSLAPQRNRPESATQRALSLLALRNRRPAGGARRDARGGGDADRLAVEARRRGTSIPKTTATVHLSGYGQGDGPRLTVILTGAIGDFGKGVAQPPRGPEDTVRQSPESPQPTRRQEAAPPSEACRAVSRRTGESLGISSAIVGSLAPSEGVSPNATTRKRPVQHQSGAPGWNRTSDTRFRKPVLYPLSYEGIVPICRGFSSATARTRIPELRKSCEICRKRAGATHQSRRWSPTHGSCARVDPVKRGGGAPTRSRSPAG